MVSLVHTRSLYIYKAFIYSQILNKVVHLDLNALSFILPLTLKNTHTTTSLFPPLQVSCVNLFQRDPWIFTKTIWEWMNQGNIGWGYVSCEWTHVFIWTANSVSHGYQNMASPSLAGPGWCLAVARTPLVFIHLVVSFKACQRGSWRLAGLNTGLGFPPSARLSPAGDHVVSVPPASGMLSSLCGGVEMVLFVNSFDMGECVSRVKNSVYSRDWRDFSSLE